MTFSPTPIYMYTTVPLSEVPIEFPSRLQTSGIFPVVFRHPGRLTFVFLRVTFRDSPFLRSSHVLTKDEDSVDSPRPSHYSTSDRRVLRAPTFSPHSTLTLSHWSIGYRNHNPQTLTEWSTRLMYLRVYDSRDISRHPVPSPSLSYSITRAQRSICYHNYNPQTLPESSVRLMYLRVYDNRDISCQPAPSRSLSYLLTHAHWSIGYRNRNPQSQSLTESSVSYRNHNPYPLTESSARLM